MNQIIVLCTEIVREIYEKNDASHDFSHIERVVENAMNIVKTEPNADQNIVHLAALLHDIEDAKYFTDGSPTIQDILNKIGVNEEIARKILACILSVSFSGGNENEVTTIEGAILRDADRLDAIGAIGIARAFAYGGAKGRKIYDLNEDARFEMTEEEYRGKNTASLTHFYEKLFLLKDLMLTNEGKRLARERHEFMVQFVTQLYKEIGVENYL